MKTCVCVFSYNQNPEVLHRFVRSIKVKALGVSGFSVLTEYITRMPSLKPGKGGRSANLHFKRNKHKVL